MNPTKASKWIFSRPIYLVSGLFYFALLLASLFIPSWYGISWSVVALALIGGHFASSIKTVGARENGVVELFGWIVPEDKKAQYRHFSSGPHFIPWPMHLHLFTKEDITVNFGTLKKDDPLMQKKIREAEKSSSFYINEEPIHITFGEPQTSDDKAKYKGHRLATQLTTDPHFYFTMRICDPATYYERIGESVTEGIERIISAATRAFQGMAGKTFVAKANSMISEMSAELMEFVSNMVGDPDSVDTNKNAWGVDIREFEIKTLGIHRDVNIKMIEVSNAQADAEITVIASEADKTKKMNEAAARRITLTEEGAGSAAAKTADAAANAAYVGQELEVRAKVAETEGGQRLVALDAWKEGLKGGKVVITSMDMSGPASILMAGKELLDATGKVATPQPPPAPQAPPAPPSSGTSA